MVVRKQLSRVLGIVVVVLLALTLNATRALAGAEVVCHRGANEYAPENTRAAAQLCIDWKVAYVEVDVRTSKDGVLYILHDFNVDRTTNGKGFIHQLTSDQIDQLDAGSWFDPKFKDERVPRLEPYLEWIKGKAKVYFDVKACDLQQLIDLVYKTGMENDCFFWFDAPKRAVEFRKLDKKLPLKVNAGSVADLKRAHDELGANIIEVGLERVTPELQDACRELNVKLMIYEPKKDADLLRRAAELRPDMINLNNADLYQKLEKEVEMQEAAAAK